MREDGFRAQDAENFVVVAHIQLAHFLLSGLWSNRGVIPDLLRGAHFVLAKGAEDVPRVNSTVLIKGTSERVVAIGLRTVRVFVVAGRCTGSVASVPTVEVVSGREAVSVLITFPGSVSISSSLSVFSSVVSASICSSVAFPPAPISSEVFPARVSTEFSVVFSVTVSVAVSVTVSARVAVRVAVEVLIGVTIGIPVQVAT